MSFYIVFLNWFYFTLFKTEDLRPEGFQVLVTSTLQLRTFRAAQNWVAASFIFMLPLKDWVKFLLKSFIMKFYCCNLFIEFLKYLK